MATAPVGLVVIRAWTEEGSERPLRVVVRLTGDSRRGFDRELVFSEPTHGGDAMATAPVPTRGTRATTRPSGTTQTPTRHRRRCHEPGAHPFPHLMPTEARRERYTSAPRGGQRPPAPRFPGSLSPAPAAHDVRAALQLPHPPRTGTDPTR